MSSKNTNVTKGLVGFDYIDLPLCKIRFAKLYLIIKIVILCNSNITKDETFCKSSQNALTKSFYCDQIASKKRPNKTLFGEVLSLQQ